MSGVLDSDSFKSCGLSRPDHTVLRAPCNIGDGEAGGEVASNTVVSMVL